MGEAFIPVTLLLFLCIPLTLLGLLAIAQMRLGRFLNLPKREGIPLHAHLKLLLLGEAPRIREADWAQFEILMSQVASGQVHIHEKLGPDIPQSVDPMRKQSMDATHWVFFIISGILILAATVGVYTFTMTRMTMTGEGVTTAMKLMEPLAGGWEETGPNLIETRVNSSGLVKLVRNAHTAGFNVTCPDIPPETLEDALTGKTPSRPATINGKINPALLVGDDNYRSCIGTMGKYLLTFTAAEGGFNAAVSWE
jgi:hypothetical protein